MSKKYLYDNELGIAGIEDDFSKIGVYTLVQQPGIKKAAFNAYSGARYSRSDKSIFEILKELVNTALGKGITADEHAADRLEKVVQGYGHPSVADMSHNFICIENVPMVTIMRFFYLNAKQDGQERSTRFQDFSKPNFYIPTERTGDEKYNEILHGSIASYNALKDETYGALKDFFKIDESDNKQKSALDARTFDTIRFFIPMGMRTSGCAVMSSRDWSRYISHMRGSSQIVEQQLGELLFELLTGNEELTARGYVPESDVLIRHAEPNSDHNKTLSSLKESLKNNCILESKKLKNSLTTFGVNTVDATTAFADHIALLISEKTISSNDVRAGRVAKGFFKESSGIIFDKHYHYNQLGPVFQMGSIGVKSVIDLGSLKDFNRQRSLERFIPFCENTVDIPVLLSHGYKLCEYLYQQGLGGLRKKYEERLNKTYADIRTLAKEERYSLEDIRYLLPHANQTPFRVYGSLDDMMYVQMLRVKPGGHINYRMEADRWRTWFSESNIFGLDELWSEIGFKSPDPSSHDEFIDRS